MNRTKINVCRLLFSGLLLLGLGISHVQQSEAASMKSEVGLTLKEDTTPSSTTEPSTTTETTTTTTYPRTGDTTTGSSWWSSDTGSGDDWLHSKPIGRLPMTGEQIVGSLTGIGALLILLAAWLLRRKQRKGVKK